MTLRTDWKTAKKNVKTKDWESLIKFKDGLGPQLDKCAVLAAKAKDAGWFEADKALEVLNKGIEEAEKIVAKYKTEIAKSSLQEADQKTLTTVLTAISKSLKELSSSTEAMIKKLRALVSDAAAYGDL